MIIRGNLKVTAYLKTKQMNLINQKTLLFTVFILSLDIYLIFWFLSK